MLFHVSTWSELTAMKKGDVFTLRPGRQNAEGIGVYFSEAVERVSAADSVHIGNTHTATVVIDQPVENIKADWFRSKKSNLNGRARTWHSKGKSLECRVVRVDGRFIFCTFTFAEVQK